MAPSERRRLQHLQRCGTAPVSALSCDESMSARTHNTSHSRTSKGTKLKPPADQDGESAPNPGVAAGVRGGYDFPPEAIIHVTGSRA